MEPIVGIVKNWVMPDESSPVFIGTVHPLESLSPATIKGSGGMTEKLLTREPRIDDFLVVPESGLLDLRDGVCDEGDDSEEAGA